MWIESIKEFLSMRDYSYEIYKPRVVKIIPRKHELKFWLQTWISCWFWPHRLFNQKVSNKKTAKKLPVHATCRSTSQHSEEKLTTTMFTVRAKLIAETERQKWRSTEIKHWRRLSFGWRFTDVRPNLMASTADIQYHSFHKLVTLCQNRALGYEPNSLLRGDFYIKTLRLQCKKGIHHDGQRSFSYLKSYVDNLIRSCWVIESDRCSFESAQATCVARSCWNSLSRSSAIYFGPKASTRIPMTLLRRLKNLLRISNRARAHSKTQTLTPQAASSTEASRRNTLGFRHWTWKWLMMGDPSRTLSHLYHRHATVAETGVEAFWFSSRPSWKISQYPNSRGNLSLYLGGFTTVVMPKSTRDHPTSICSPVPDGMNFSSRSLAAPCRQVPTHILRQPTNFDETSIQWSQFEISKSCNPLHADKCCDIRRNRAWLNAH